MAISGLRSFWCQYCGREYRGPYIQDFDNETGMSVLIAKPTCQHDTGAKIVTGSRIASSF